MIEGLAPDRVIVDDPPPELNEAEQLGLVVAAAYGDALAARDQARSLAVRLEQDLAAALAALEQAVATWPRTSWAADSLARQDVAERLDQLRRLPLNDDTESPKEGA